jgi:hypothetical protein
MEVDYQFLRRQIDERKALIAAHTEHLSLLGNKLERTTEKRKRRGLLRRISTLRREIKIYHQRNKSLEILLPD